MLGKLLGVGLLQGDYTPMRFTVPFLKQLLQQPLDSRDLEQVDPVLYKNKVQGLMECSAEELQALDLCFVEQETAFGATTVPSRMLLATP